MPPRTSARTSVSSSGRSPSGATMSDGSRIQNRSSALRAASA